MSVKLGKVKTNTVFLVNPFNYNLAKVNLH